MFRWGVLAACLVLAALPPTRASADGDSQTVKTTGNAKSKARASAQPPRADEIERLRAVARNLESAVAQVGWLSERDATPRPYGTAFVISRKHRLLATAAHVADGSITGGGLVVLLHGGKLIEPVERVYYHPAVRREFDEGLVAPSMDPNDGEVANPGVDIAVLQLAQDLPELPAEVELASDQELRDLVSRPVATAGYPHSDNPNSEWPSPTFPLPPSFRAGRIAQQVAYIQEQSEDNYVDDSAGFGQRRWVRSTISLGAGCSGGPVFQENGHVLAVNVTGGSASIETGDEWISGHIRVDFLRELVDYHGLSDRSGKPAGREAVRPDKAHERRLSNLREAVELVRTAKGELLDNQFRKAEARCNQALILVPDYANAYLQRSKVYLACCATQWDSLTESERHRLTRAAWRDADRCWAVTIGPKASEATRKYVEEFRDTVGWKADFGEKSRGWESEMLSFRSHLQLLNDETDPALTDAQEAVSLDPKNSVAFLSRGYAWQAKGEYDKALSDLAEALKLNPREPRAHFGRGYTWYFKERYDRALDSFCEAIRFDPDNARTFSERGDIYTAQHELNRAIADFTAAIRIDPRLATAWAGRARARWEKHDYAGAEADISEAIRFSPYAPNYYAKRGASRLETGDYDGAIADCTIAIGFDSEQFGAYYNRGAVWLRKGAYDKAISDLSESIRIDPKFTNSYWSRALAWKAKADYAKTLEDYAVCIRLEPKTPVHRNSRAWLLAVCPDAKHRDGPRAVQDAALACELSGWKIADYVDTLAAAHAECVHFAEAVKCQEMVLKLLTSTDDKKAPYRARLDLYRAGKPYHESP